MAELPMLAKMDAAELCRAIEGGDLNATGFLAQDLANRLGGRLNLQTVSPGIAAVYLVALIVRGDHGG